MAQGFSPAITGLLLCDHRFHGLDDVPRRDAEPIQQLSGFAAARDFANRQTMHGEAVVEGACDGRITRTPRGDGGFGYDPVFFYPPLCGTFGELSDEQKALVSHRGRAAAAAKAALAGFRVA